MKPRSRTSGKKPAYGPNIVRAWFDTVFQYALRGLENERRFLLQGNWTYRFRRLRLEYLVPFEELIPLGARDNLEQFISFFPEVGKAIAHHDAKQHELEQSCRAFFTAILESTAFLNVFQSVAAEAPEAMARAYSSEADQISVLAEYLVNHVEELPEYYTTSELWNCYRDRFVDVLSGSELAIHRTATEQTGREMLDAVDQLTALLKATRSDLSLKFDLPYVGELSNVR